MPDDDPSPTLNTPSTSGERLALTAAIKQRAHAIGFELIGVAPAIRAGTWEQLDEWLARGFAGEMRYIERRKEAYRHPEHVLPQVRSVVMLGLVYGSGGPANQQLSSDLGEQHGASRWHDVEHAPKEPAAGAEPLTPQIARYAQGTRDYHDVIRQKLKQLADALHELQPGCKTRGVVDTAPLLERDFARLAGLGWFGKNTLLINKRMGSELFLAALLTDCELEPDEPHLTQHCGTCTRCLDVCPTGAFPEPYVLDATKCISYLTIELRNAPIPAQLRAGMGDWLFGCDECQTVCPWNRKAPATQVPAFDPDPTWGSRSLSEWLTLAPDDFRQQLGKTPLSRSGWSGITRNACIAAGNSGETAYLPALRLLAENADAVVQEAAHWAIGRIEERETP